MSTLLKFLVTLPWESRPVLHARSRVLLQGINLISRLLEVVPIVGINELHPAHQKTYDDGVRKKLPDAWCYGSLGGNALFWRRPQRGAGTGGGRAVRGGQA